MQGKPFLKPSPPGWCGASTSTFLMTLRVAACTFQKPGQGGSRRAAEVRAVPSHARWWGWPCACWGWFLHLSMGSLHCCFLLVPGYSVFLFSLVLKLFLQLLPLSGLGLWLAIPPSPGAEMAESPQDINSKLKLTLITAD